MNDIYSSSTEATWENDNADLRHDRNNNSNGNTERGRGDGGEKDGEKRRGERRGRRKRKENKKKYARRNDNNKGKGIKKVQKQ